MPLAVGNEIIKWNLADLLGPKHPAVRRMMGIAQKSTEGLDQLPPESLSSAQCLAMGLQAVENKKFDLALAYYFQALEDKNRFTEVCTEINYAGIRLRNMGQMDQAIRFYDKLLTYNPHNQGSVFWNMAIAYAYKNDALTSSGYVARCMYTDPYLAREKEFYDSISPQIHPVILALMRKLTLVIIQAKKTQPPPQLVTLYKHRDRLIRLAAEGQVSEALKIFVGLFKQARVFLVKPEVWADGILLTFLKKAYGLLGKKPTPQTQPVLQMIQAYVRYIQEHPAPPKVKRFLELCQATIEALEQGGDQNQAAFLVSQGLMVAPDEYFARADFFARDNLPQLVQELATKFSYVNPKRFPSGRNPVR
jgi:tetratricopeptide (TPR) repeat protein